MSVIKLKFSLMTTCISTQDYVDSCFTFVDINANASLNINKKGLCSVLPERP